MKWFKLYHNADKSLEVSKIIDEFGLVGYARYLLILQLLCEKFDGESIEFEIHFRDLLGKLIIRTRTQLDNFIKRLGSPELGLSCLRAEILKDRCYKFTAPILLELQDRDFKKARKERGDSAPKKETKKKTKTKIKKKELQPGIDTPAASTKDVNGSETWKAYSTAYYYRYGTAPIRNAKVNSQILNFVKRVGVEQAPHVAAFYIEHNNSFYITKGHSTNQMLLDAEKLYMEWKTNKKITRADVKSAEFKDHATSLRKSNPYRKKL